jgi:hypothetical protein
MDLNEALDKARRIIIEEDAEPTIYYLDVSSELSPSVVSSPKERRVEPGHVYEDPTVFVFKSANFDLLIRVFSQVSEVDRSEFINAVLSLVREPLKAKKRRGSAKTFPSVDGKISALSLIAEFMIRTGHLRELLAATAVPDLPTESIAVMLMEIEESICLNFNLFSESDLAAIPEGLALLRNIAERQTYSARGTIGGPMVDNPHYKYEYQDVGNLVVKKIDDIREACRKADYYYLRGALQELPNLEIEQDKKKVESYLSALGFNSMMQKSLDAAEVDYRSDANEFELKNSLGHLRTFYEQLHFQVGHILCHKAGRGRDEKFGQVLTSLRILGFFTEKEEKFAAGLYGLLSVEAVHALFAKREYARLMRNMVIEYGVMFLSMMENEGIKIIP